MNIDYSKFRLELVRNKDGYFKLNIYLKFHYLDTNNEFELPRDCIYSFKTNKKYSTKENTGSLISYTRNDSIEYLEVYVRESFDEIKEMFNQSIVFEKNLNDWYTLVPISVLNDLHNRINNPSLNCASENYQITTT